jgi:hypothetical protein
MRDREAVRSEMRAEALLSRHEPETIVDIHSRAYSLARRPDIAHDRPCRNSD